MRTLDQQMGSMSFGYRFKKIEYDNLKMIPKSFYILCRVVNMIMIHENFKVIVSLQDMSGLIEEIGTKLLNESLEVVILFYNKLLT